MFMVSEADAAAIRTMFNAEGAFIAALELRRRFPGVTGNADAPEGAPTIATWRPIVMQLRFDHRRRKER
jgi:hypothetical protein